MRAEISFDAKFWSKLDWMPPIGIVAIVLHPTVASFFGPQVSKFIAASSIVFLLPACRRIIVAPFLSIAACCLLLAIVVKSKTTILLALPAYAIFYLLKYKTATFYRVMVAISLFAMFVALLQFLIPSDLLNFHATADSAGRFLDRYRPTSIFPAQIYYNQFLLLMIPLFFLVEERKAWLLLIFGFSAGITGSTSAIVFVALSLLLDVKRVGLQVLLGFVAAITFTALFDRARLLYNFSPDDIVLSVASRLRGASLDMGSEADAVLTKIITAHPGMTLLTQSLAVCALLLAIPMFLRMKAPPSAMLALISAFSSVLVGQMFHQIAGTVYYSLTLGVLAVLALKFVDDFTAPCKRSHSEHGLFDSGTRNISRPRSTSSKKLECHGDQLSPPPISV